MHSRSSSTKRIQLCFGYEKKKKKKKKKLGVENFRIKDEKQNGAYAAI